MDYPVENGYAVLTRKWKKGDKVDVVLPMEVRTVKAIDSVKNDIGKIALQRGPIVYCAEWADNNGKVSNILLPSNTTFSTVYKPSLFNGVTVIEGEVPVVKISADGLSVSTAKQKFTAIPYYTWANRGEGEMTVWFPEKVTDLELLPGK